MAKIDLAGKLGDARARVEAETPSEQRGLAKYARLTRKDARIRPDQELSLTALADVLMRRRTVRVERITENTLIRVAIDLLLTRADDLRGSTEDELRNSVTCRLPTSETSTLTESETAEVRNQPARETPDSAPADAGHARALPQSPTVPTSLVEIPAPERGGLPVASAYPTGLPVPARHSRALPGDPVPTWHPPAPTTQVHR